MKILLFFIILLEIVPTFGKDIDLDKIYIKDDSRLYRKLLDKKIDVHKAINSLFVDRDVIFANWISGNQIIYAKELSASNTIVRYNIIHHSREEVLRFKGVITNCTISNNKRYLFIKRFIPENGSFPQGETMLLNIETGKVIILKTPNLFIDYTQSPDGNSILYESNRGIIEHFPVTGIIKLICRRVFYSDIEQKNAVTMLYFSPNRMKKIIISGSGGFYVAKILTSKQSWKISNLSSATEISWLNNRYFLYRSGSPGYYSINLYDTVKRRTRRIITNSMNTNLSYSINAGIAAALRNQIVHIYKISDNSLVNIGIEGEDIYFSPDGNRFTSLLLKKLFITNYHSIGKYSLILKKNSKMILDIYKDLLNNKENWTNEYTSQYLKKKITEYKNLAGEE